MLKFSGREYYIDPTLGGVLRGILGDHFDSARILLI